MENYLGIIVAVEQYHDNSHLKNVAFAKNDATEFLNSLINLGCDKTKFEILLDNHATKTSITEKLNQVSTYANSTDVIIFYYAGHGFYYNGKNLISSVDTYLNALESTALNLYNLLGILDKSKSNKVMVFLDCCHSGIEFTETERSPITDFNADDLKNEYRHAEHLTVFASCKSDEKSQTDIKRNHGVWSYFLIDALKGKPKHIYEGSILFSDQLQKYLLKETFHRVKSITDEKKNQTPIKYGKETAERFIVADLSKLFTEEEMKRKANSMKLESTSIINSEEDYVKSLPGFRTGNKAPKEISDYHERWIQKIGSELIKSELEEVLHSLKEKLNYKRKDIQNPEVDDGTGILSTIYFDYVVSITQSKDDSTKYILTRSIENFKNSDVVYEDGFNEVFSKRFDELRLRLNKPINIEEIIDKIEELENDNIKVYYTTTKSCEIIIKGLDGNIYLVGKNFSFLKNRKSSPIKLIEDSIKAYKSIGELSLKLLE